MLTIQPKTYSNSTPVSSNKQPINPQASKPSAAKDTISFGNLASEVSSWKKETLWTGMEESEAIVNFVSSAMHDLYKKGIAGIRTMHDFLGKCRNPDYKIPTSTAEELKKMQLLLPDGNISEPVQNIMSAVTKGDGIELRFVDPISGEKL